MRRRSVSTTAVPVPNLSENIPPYCFAHSVNLNPVSHVIGVDSAHLLQMRSFLGDLVKVAYDWKSGRSCSWS